MENLLKDLPKTNDFINLAKDNRKKFLEPYRVRYEKAEKEVNDIKSRLRQMKHEIVTDAQGEVLGRKNVTNNEKKLRERIPSIKKDQAEIVIELIQLEPSHLTEPWILREVIEWLRDRDCRGYLENAFVRKGKRKLLTKQQREKFWFYFGLKNLIDRMVSEKGITRSKAFERLGQELAIKLSESDNIPKDLQPELVIKKYYYGYKKYIDQEEFLKDRNVPYPYWGYDINIHEDGELEREFILFEELPKLS